MVLKQGEKVSPRDDREVGQGALGLVLIRKANLGLMIKAEYKGKNQGGSFLWERHYLPVGNDIISLTDLTHPNQPIPTNPSQPTHP